MKKLKVKKGRIGIYPGTFDPPTNGHLDLIRRGALIFDRLIVAIAHNSEKTPLFKDEERLEMLKRITADLSNVEVRIFNGLMADFAEDCGASAILRGVRSVADFEYELQMAIANRHLTGEAVDTIFMMPSLQNTFISSRLVKEAALHGGNISKFVPALVNKALKSRRRAK